jgi:hypothetical protein
MPGEIQTGSVRQVGPGKTGNLGIGSEKKNLIIFREPLFDNVEFRVKNDGLIPGRNPNEFVGLDSYGWGVHPDGTVNVVDATECRNGFGTKTPGIGLQALWALEANAVDIERAQNNLEDGYKRFLKRMIKSVTLSKTAVTLIPDPRIWLIQVTLERGQSIGPTLVGTLVPWPRPIKQVEETRLSTYELRPTKIEFKDQRDKRWPRTTSPAE